MILVFDTNVFLTKNANLWELLEYFPSPETPPRFFVGLDREQIILDEYLRYAEVVDPEDPIRIILERILDGSGLFVIQRTSKQARKSLVQRLHSCGCTMPIEPELFAISTAFKHGILVHPNYGDKCAIVRSYLNTDTLRSIQEGNVGPQTMSLYEVLRLLREPSEYAPDSLDDLDEYLHKYRFGGKHSEEREFLEFKCPEEGYLSQLLLRKAVAAVCGLLNTREGWVFVGVDDTTGEIKPFPAKYKDATKQSSLDQILRDVYGEINRICPKPGKLTHIWALLDDIRQNCVIAIRVHKGNKDYLYRDRDGQGSKLASTKYIRIAAQTVVDPDWVSH